MSISKLFNVNYVKQGLKSLFLPAVMVLPLVAGGCAVGGGLAAGVATSQGLQAAGVNRGVANLLGVAVGLGTAEVIAQGQQAQGRCTEESVAVRGSRGNAWEERRECRRTTRGYQTGPYQDGGQQQYYRPAPVQGNPYNY